MSFASITLPGGSLAERLWALERLVEEGTVHCDRPSILFGTQRVPIEEVGVLLWGGGILPYPTRRGVEPPRGGFTSFTLAEHIRWLRRQTADSRRPSGGPPQKRRTTHPHGLQLTEAQREERRQKEAARQERVREASRKDAEARGKVPRPGQPLETFSRGGRGAKKKGRRAA